jgi:hypothetical protein
LQHHAFAAPPVSRIVWKGQSVLSNSIPPVVPDLLKLAGNSTRERIKDSLSASNLTLFKVAGTLLERPVVAQEASRRAAAAVLASVGI